MAVAAKQHFRCVGTLERRLRACGFSSIAGADEAGRGSLFGPVFAAAVILSPERAILQRVGTWSVVRLGGEVPYPSCEQTPQAVIEELFGGWCFIARGELRRIGSRSLG